MKEKFKRFSMPRKTSAKKIREQLDANFDKACRDMLRVMASHETKLRAMAAESEQAKEALRKAIAARDEFIRAQFQRSK